LHALINPVKGNQLTRRTQMQHNVDFIRRKAVATIALMHPESFRPEQVEQAASWVLDNVATNDDLPLRDAAMRFYDEAESLYA
jgi:hypothetical protein